MSPTTNPRPADGQGHGQDPWPALDGAGWLETVDSLKLWGQIVGKTRLALSPMINHWWQVAFYVSARGLTTSPIPVGERVLDIEFDFIDHALVARTSDGGVASTPLCESPLTGFYAAYMEQLRRLEVEVSIRPFAVEMPERVQLDQDTRICRYDPTWANRYFRVLAKVDQLLKQFRGRFLGKASPVHFFWGGFDLAVTRFSGRTAPPHPGGIPNVGDWVMREAYSHEVSSAGFWPGDARFPEAAFYAYAYPQPAGFEGRAVRPAAARWEPSLGEFVLPYRALRAARDPAAAVIEFLETSYEAAADLAGWDRAGLERHGPIDGRPARRAAERRAP
jgi:hypothetical protein